MHFLAGGPDITPITDLITTWIHIGQGLVGSIGALAFIFALAWSAKQHLLVVRVPGRQDPAHSHMRLPGQRTTPPGPIPRRCSQVRPGARCVAHAPPAPRR